jgi:anti-anti-sigma regulatory factor
MFDVRDEAFAVLTPKSGVNPDEVTISKPWELRSMRLSPSAGVSVIHFDEDTCLNAENLTAFQQDLMELEQGLPKNSKVLFDFTGVTMLDAASIDALVSFKEKLQIKGSRMVLCCLAPAPRDAFFAIKSPADPPITRPRRRY